MPSLELSEKLFKPPNFELSYDGHDNLKINKKLIKLYNKIYPNLKKLRNILLLKMKK